LKALRVTSRKGKVWEEARLLLMLSMISPAGRFGSGRKPTNFTPA
jgi:hypothetical protein